MPAWTASLTSTAPVAGPAGFYYADVPNRIIAFVIDFIVLIIVQFVVLLIIAAIASPTVGGNVNGAVNTTYSILATILSTLVTAAYFIYTWSAMRGSPGMKVLGMQIGFEIDGRTLTYSEATLRYLVLWGPWLAATVVGYFAPGLAAILWLLGFIWFIALLVTTAQSPTKQGLHDRYAHTMVVKAARRAV
jgi:uncharacterized RDD family membrane protein YckC